MAMRRTPSPFRAPSPYAPQPVDPQYIPHNGLPTGTAQVGPGAMTYTTSTGPDGRIIYQPFKAVAASYQTPSGVVSGIQWIPGEPTTVRPSGSQYSNPPAADPGGGWHGGGYSSSYKDEYTSAPEWQRADEKRRKQEEKDAKRHWERDGRNDSEYELRLARERDAQSTANRDRRKSFNSGNPVPTGSVAFPVAGGSSGYPTHPTTGYPSSPYSNYAALNPPAGPAYSMGPSGHSKKSSGSYPDIARQFKDIDLSHSNDHGERDRKLSNNGPRKYSTSDNTYERTRTYSGNYADRPNLYPSPPGSYAPSGPYSNPKNQATYANPYPASHYTTASPNMRASDISSFGTANSTGYPGSSYTSSPSRNAADLITRSTTPFGVPPPQFYPRGHVLEGQPIVNNNPRSRAPSRAASPNPGAFPQVHSSPHIGKSPRMPIGTMPGEPQQLPAPEAFSRPINAANAFSPFDILKIQDMDEINTKYPKMPTVLSTHDIYQEDWKRCMQDLGRSWTGQLPVPGFGKDGQPPRRSTLAADLIELWNASFFLTRGVELVLYKGRERRTGPQAGQIDTQLPSDDTDDSSSSPSSESDGPDYGNRMTDQYGRTVVGQSDLQEANRRRYDEKMERRRRRKERKARRKAKARDKTYSVYIAYLSRGPIPFGTRPVVQGGYASNPTAPGAYGAATYGALVGIPTTRSHGYGGDY
ncbi:hypothetical protein GALMADRAFT_235562 [Galerina marginata CBS 339.88]|uniref:Uncharacterized protein n=1 Tax=Galerina marginata (strain CBS 339.88) TaxID=685588 RepID=A0A067TU60_GALM3|nr:hypothetical protein GALMADRAFT_235562 [Galerina marginata CBS 339.88]